MARSFPALRFDVTKMSLMSWTGSREALSSVLRASHGGKKGIWIAVIFVTSCGVNLYDLLRPAFLKEKKEKEKEMKFHVKRCGILGLPPIYF